MQVQAAWRLVGMGVFVWLTALVGRAEPVQATPQAAETGPAGYWAFDETEGSVANDAAGKLHLRNLGGAWVKGVRGGSLSLDGELTWCDVADEKLPAAFPGKQGGTPGSFSFTCWIRLYALGRRHPILVKEGDLTRGFMLSVERQDRLAFHVYANRDEKSEVESLEPLKLRTWQHVAVCYKYVANGTSVLQLYVDGKLQQSDNTAVGPAIQTALPFEIGHVKWSSAYEKFLFGRIDELRWYDRALTAQEVAELANPPADSAGDE